jgi:hypothetical protein
LMPPPTTSTSHADGTAADGRAGVGEREFTASCFPVSIDSVRLPFV